MEAPLDRTTGALTGRRSFAIWMAKLMYDRPVEMQNKPPWSTKRWMAWRFSGEMVPWLS